MSGLADNIALRIDNGEISESDLACKLQPMCDV